MRGLATAAKVKEVLPLKGIKVLDMTRVLAGVSFFFSFSFFFFLALLGAKWVWFGGWELGTEE
jgi:hypothetical protein